MSDGMARRQSTRKRVNGNAVRVSNGDGRAENKKQWIMEAALPVFLRNGYLGTSMDEIAAVAAVSKQTVYKHFENKEGLFTDIVFSTIENAYSNFDAVIRVLRDSTDVDNDIRVFARVLLTALMQPRVVQIRRLVIAEANRFPELGNVYYEKSYESAVGLLSTSIKHQAEQGNLKVDDPLMAAHHLTWLVLGVPRNKVMLCGDQVRFTRAELDRYADEAAHAFLAAYGRR
jgi:TetR/AcrR family transcriptional regulator, mexJK operon transcriptional repressor